MIARRPRSPASRRRGVVLILVLSMLGLLAVIGVSFAAFSGQARSAARVYSQKLNRPPADDLIEFAVRQLINDTTNPMSALYGHGLKRDMYGNDATENGFYDRNPDGFPPRIVGPPTPVYDPDTTGRTRPAEWTITTNIPNYVGYNFRGWILTIPGTNNTVAQTFEVRRGDNISGPTYVLEITGSHVPSAGTDGANGPKGMSTPFNGAPFTLDGRYRHAFNGTGMAALATNVNQAMTGPGDPNLNDRGNRNPGQFANFRVSGGLLEGDPLYTPRPFNVNRLPLDEDYDAPDLENWFLAAQSADGRVLVPSFHRPGILAVDGTGLSDMEVTHPSDFPPGSEGTPEYRRAVRAISKILTPRPADHRTAGFSNLEPNTNGIIDYPVDNDGDGNGDSVWLDLGFPVQRAADGTLYKPLFSFMAVGLNGRLPLNTAGNLNARVATDDPSTPNVDEAGLPLFDHASHLGFSPSEINPLPALQNAADPSPDVASNVIDGAKPNHQQFDDAEFVSPNHNLDGVRHIPIALSQLRSLLTGTRIDLNNENAEWNFVRINGTDSTRIWNNVFDSADERLVSNSNNLIDRRNSRSVPGRWGEPDAVPPLLRKFPYSPGIDPISPALDHALNFNTSRVNLSLIGLATEVDMPNPVRPGQSPYPAGEYLIDGIDNNLDTVDFLPRRTATEGPEASLSGLSDAHDLSNLPILTSERWRRFVTPLDPTGNGLVSRFNQAPSVGLDGNGALAIMPADIGPDGRGRVSFLHYFRPPGVPLDTDDGVRLILNTGAPAYVLSENRHNQYHGFHSFLFPPGGNGHLMAAMPYDLTNNGTSRIQDPNNAANLVANPPTDLFDPSGQYVGTFSPSKNANPLGRLTRDPAGLLVHLGDQPEFQTGPLTAVHSYPLGSPQFNDPNEMNLYWPEVTDAPFGSKDLEWLYRYGDVDGASLESRLADLAPVSFVHAADAQNRRRMFSVETWDRIDYAFANDNPGGLGVPFATNPPAGTVLLAPADSTDQIETPPGRMARPQVNARFIGTASASFDGLDRPAPGVAHGGRRINLNHPFPHSYNPRESVRQKWITETYQTLKMTLPPHAVDTPHELAKLGQFVVNIVDFRDPDNAITIWDNPDVSHRPARRDTNGVDYPPSIHLPYLANGDVDPDFALGRPLRHFGMEYQPVAINEVLGLQFNYSDYGQAGIPANPNDPPSARNAKANRLYIELVNMLSRSDADSASDLDLNMWDFVMVREDPNSTWVDPSDPNATPYFHPAYVRPDPVTGQVPDIDPASEPFHPPVLPETANTTIGKGQAVPVPIGSPNIDLNDRPTSYLNSRLDPAIEALRVSGRPKYYVLGGLRISGAVPPAANMEEFVDSLEAGVGDPDFDHFPDNDPDNEWQLIPNPRDTLDDDAIFGTGSTRTEGLYFWLYLRRPANPLAPPDPVANPMVVVDSIRFPFSRSDGEGQTRRNTDGTFVDERRTNQSQPIYSIERHQPYRGGQLVPDPQDVTRPLFIYGSSEQARPSRNRDGSFRYTSIVEGTNLRNRLGQYPDDTQPPLGYPTVGQFDPQGNSRDDSPNGDNNAELWQTIGSENDRVSRLQNSQDPNHEAWDYLVFNDRDFMSVAELMLVPGCPPGLFTKQFVEAPPEKLAAAPIPPTDTDGDNRADAQLATFYDIPPRQDANLIPRSDTEGVALRLEHTQVRTYPYLAHEFYFSSPATEVITHGADFDGDGFPNNRLVGGQTGAGWYKMFEIFEVPSPVIDAIGPVAQGLNFDWFRQDRRPGQLNMNLIYDEEVFFGLLNDPRLLNATNLLDSFVGTRATDTFPRVVTQVDLDGKPVQSDRTFELENPGFTVFSTDPAGHQLDRAPTSASYPWSGMKRAFADFLKLRHGGSGYLFAFGDGLVGTGSISDDTFPVAADRPFRSLSFPDINYTLMRPATLPPSAFTIPTLDVDVQDPGLKSSQYDPLDLAAPRARLDPGVVYQPTPGNPSTYYANPERLRQDATATRSMPIVPPVPPRRLFQVPDWSDTIDLTTALENWSNAAVAFDPSTVGAAMTYTPVTNANTELSQVSTGAFFYPGLFSEWTHPVFGAQWVDPATGASSYLGGSVVGGDISTHPAGAPTVPWPSGTSLVDRAPDPGPRQNDMRRHPYYRTEMLQKVSNLTTPRTHQYAVWVTVGLFEVVKPGDRAQLIPDELGPELGLASGSNVRYRSFFVLDRTRATGFNPLRPGDYRDVIVYSRRIE